MTIDEAGSLSIDINGDRDIGHRDASESRRGLEEEVAGKNGISTQSIKGEIRSDNCDADKWSGGKSESFNAIAKSKLASHRSEAGVDLDADLIGAERNTWNID